MHIGFLEQKNNNSGKFAKSFNFIFRTKHSPNKNPYNLHH